MSEEEWAEYFGAAWDGWTPEEREQYKQRARDFGEVDEDDRRVDGHRTASELEDDEEAGRDHVDESAFSDGSDGTKDSDFGEDVLTVINGGASIHEDAAEEARASADRMLDRLLYKEDADALDGELQLGTPQQARAHEQERTAQQDALRDLGYMAAGSRTPEDLAREQQMRAAAETTQRGGVNAAAQQMAEQGGGQAGEYAGSLANAQMGNQWAADWDSEMAAQQAQRQQAALQELGQLGSTVRKQGFTEAAEGASWVDRFNANNTQYRRDVATRNADATNRRREVQADVANSRAVSADRRGDAAYERERTRMGAYGTAAARGTDSSGPSYYSSPSDSGSKDSDSDSNPYGGY